MPLGPITPRALENTLSAPCSFHVGTDEKLPPRRFAADTASTRNRPAVTCETTPDTGTTATSTCPPITLVKDCTPEVNTTNFSFFTSTPALFNATIVAI